MRHLTSAAPGARPRAACPTPQSPNGTSRSTTTAPAYIGHARLDAPASGQRTFDWRGVALLALVLFVMFLGLLGLMMFHPVPAANKDVLNILLGALGGSFATVIAYYYGSSASSDTKTAILGRVAEGKR